MTIEQVLTIIENKGVGFVLIVLLIWFVWKLANGVEKAVADFYDLFHKAVYNHLAHFQDSLETLVKNSDDANKKLDTQSQMLGIIVDQTKPKQ